MPLFKNQSFNGSIVDIAICMGQSKFIVIGEDKSIKLFTFLPGQGEFNCIMSHVFQDSPIVVALQHHALQFVVGFKDYIKIFVPVEDKLNIGLMEKNIKGICFL